MFWAAYAGESLSKCRNIYEKIIKAIIYGILALLVISSLTLEARVGGNEGKSLATGVPGAASRDSARPTQDAGKGTPGGIRSQTSDPRTYVAAPGYNASSSSRKGDRGSRTSWRSGLSEGDIDLLAHLIYAEARGEPFEGQVAVGAVVLNRVRDWRFPKSVAGVVYEADAFCTVRDGQINLTPDTEAYRAARAAAAGWDPTGGALYFYNPARTTSMWIYSRPVLTVIGQHYFAA